MRPSFLPFSLFLLLSGGAASAQVDVNALAADLQAQGFTRIEMRETPNQLKVEAIRGTEKVETIYDKSTGAVLKTETEKVGVFENTSPGVTLQQRNRDFLKAQKQGGSDDASAETESSDDDGVSGSDDGANHDVNDDNSNDDKGGHTSGADSEHDASDDKGGDSGSGGSHDSGESHDRGGSHDGGGSGGDGGEGSGED